MEQIPDSSRPSSSWVTRTLAALLCLTAGGFAVHRVLQKAPIATVSLDVPVSEPARTEMLQEPTRFRLPPLVDQHPRQLDPLAPPASLADSLDPLGPRAPEPPAPIERREVLKVAGSAGADAGSLLPSERVTRRVQAVPEDAALPSDPPPTEPPRAEPPLPLAETLPLAEALDAPPAEAEPPGAQPPDLQPPDPQPPEVIVPGENCGFITCTTGLVCCNPSCGICAAPGASCSEEPCR